jgi:hypothetical protein
MGMGEGIEVSCVGVEGVGIEASCVCVEGMCMCVHRGCVHACACRGCALASGERVGLEEKRHMCVEGIHVGVQRMSVSMRVMGEDMCVGHESHIKVKVKSC